MGVISRREALRRAGFAGLAALLPAEVLTARRAAAVTGESAGFIAFSAHEADVVREATARLIPGPLDDPAEESHPGAREADVVRYVDTMLGALQLRPARLFAGGPYSDRAGYATDDMAEFIGLTPAEADAWRSRLAADRAAYRKGVRALDASCGGSFLAATAAEKDAALAKDPGGFTTLMFGHAIEGMYSVPEYGGNRGLVGWTDIKFPGDVAPRGFTPEEVSRSDGPDRYRPEGVASSLIAMIEASSDR